MSLPPPSNSHNTSQPQFVPRANGYYSSFTYFSSKIMFDILPLRLVPPLVFGGIVYGLVGLVPDVYTFWKFILTLVLFNLTTASVVLWLSIAFASVSVASLVGTLVMLFKCVDLAFSRGSMGSLRSLILTLISLQLDVHGAADQQRNRHARVPMAAYRLVLPRCV